MGKASSYFISVLFADWNDGNGVIPYSGHAGFILANADGEAKYFEYGPGGEHAWTQVGGSTVYSGKNSSLRKLELSSEMGFDTEDHPTQASIETALSQITSNLYGGSDPGMIFATAVAVPRPSQFKQIEDYVSISTKQIVGNGDSYSAFLNTCLNFVYHAASAGDIRISSTQYDWGVAWPAVDATSFLAETRQGFAYTAAESQNGKSIEEVNQSTYRTPAFLNDRSVQFWCAIAKDNGYLSTWALDSESYVGATYNAARALFSGPEFGVVGSTTYDHGAKTDGSRMFNHFTSDLKGKGHASAEMRHGDYTGLGDVKPVGTVDNGTVQHAMAQSIAVVSSGSAVAGSISAEPNTGQVLSGELKEVDRGAAETFYQRGIVQQRLEELGIIPKPSNLPSGGQASLESHSSDGLDGPFSSARPGFDAVSAKGKKHDDLLGILARPAHRPKLYTDIDQDVTQMKVGNAKEQEFPRDLHSDSSHKGVSEKNSVLVGAPGALPGAKAVASAGTPGWLSALSVAVAKELASKAVSNDAGMEGGPLASRQDEVEPSNARSDRHRLRVVGQGTAYCSHMPAGPTTSLPSQSLPIPGQVSFSP